MAQRVLRKTAEENKTSFPEAAKVLLNNVYMDDICDSINTVQGAQEQTEAMDKDLETGGFKVKGWISNKVLTQKKHKNQKMTKAFEAEEEKVLGMLWNCATDKFFFRVN